MSKISASPSKESSGASVSMRVTTTSNPDVTAAVVLAADSMTLMLHRGLVPDDLVMLLDELLHEASSYYSAELHDEPVEGAK